MLIHLVLMKMKINGGKSPLTDGSVKKEKGQTFAFALVNPMCKTFGKNYSKFFIDQGV